MENTKLYKLFLDDERKPSHVTWITMPLGPWVIVKNYKQFVETLQKDGLPTHVSFDHDLAVEHYPIFENEAGMHIPYDSYKEKTGYHCAEYLVAYCHEKNLDLPRCSVHTLNKAGKVNIKNILSGYAQHRRKAAFRLEGIIIPGGRSR